MATLTKSTGTVTLTGTAEKVTLPASYGWVWVKNMSEGDIFAGLSEDISEGADGVLTIPSGECGRIQTDGSRDFYLLGTGNALVVAQNYAECPFKVGGKGGEIPDLSAYAKTADVPNIKVNEAANADKINGLDSDNFRHITKNTLNSLPIQPTGEGDYFVVDSTGDFPYTWGYMSIRYGSSTNEFVVTFQSTGYDDKMYINTYRSGWLGWKEISTTPIKYATFSANADGTGNFNLWTPSENKIPIAIQLDNKPFSVVLFLYNNQMWLGSTINEVTRQPVTDTAVSGTVYYIEV